MSENTNDYEPYNAIVEPAISDISDSVPLPVKVGAQSYAWNKVAATSQTNTELRFDVNVNPTHLINREVYISGQIEAQVRINRARTSEGPIVYSGEGIELNFGETDSVRPFFFNQMIQQAQVNLGNNSISLAQRDIFDGLLKCVSKKFLSRWNSQTASYIDNSFKNYKDSNGTLNHPLQGFEDSISSAVFNGAYPVDISNIIHKLANGSDSVEANKNSLTTWDTNDDYLLATIKLEVNEPLFVNPFIYNGDWDQNKAAIYGINNFTINLQLTNNANHMFCRSSLFLQDVSYTLQSLSRFVINYTSMTPQINQILPMKSVYPLKKIDRYISNPNQPNLSAGASTNILSPGINLGSIPDYLVIYVRNKRTNQTLNTASSAFLPIKKIRIQLNNNDNLLSSLNAVDLWKLSAKNGSSQSFYEFRGNARTASASSLSVSKNTIGSVVIISATDLNLQSPITPGTLSNVLLNVDCEFTNNESATISPELVVMPISNAIMTIANGNVSMTNSLFYESNNAAVLSNSSVLISQDLAYSSKKGGNLSTLIATKLNKSLKGGNSGSGLRSAGNSGSSLFY